MLPNMEPLRKITIIPRGMALGYTKTLAEDRYLPSRSQFNDELATLMGGRVAEEIIFNDITTGAQNDIEQATKLARRMITDFGMSDTLGPRTFGHKEERVFLGLEIYEQRDYSEMIAKVIDDEMHRIIQEAYATARKLLTKNRRKLVQIADKLISEETLEGELLESLFSETGPTPSPEPTVVS